MQMSFDVSPQMLQVKTATGAIMPYSSLVIRLSFRSGLVEQHAAAALGFAVGHLKLLLLLRGQIAQVLAEAVAIGAVFSHHRDRQIRQRRILILPDAFD